MADLPCVFCVSVENLVEQITTEAQRHRRDRAAEPHPKYFDNDHFYRFSLRKRDMFEASMEASLRETEVS